MLTVATYPGVSQLLLARAGPLQAGGGGRHAAAPPRRVDDPPGPGHQHQAGAHYIFLESHSNIFSTVFFKTSATA